MKKKKQKKYFRLTKAERASIERAMDKNQSARSVARDLGRSPAAITEEIKRNRTVCKGPGKGEQVGDVPEDVCLRLNRWPGVCNGCKYRRYHCSKKWRCEYSATRAQVLADDLLVGARQGLNAKESDFELMMAHIRTDVLRGLAPSQIAQGRAEGFKVHPTTIYRWIAQGYGGMSNAQLRRQVGYKPRRRHVENPSILHGDERSYSAFCELSDDERAGACEMDTAIGKSRDRQCILTLYLRSCKVQVAPLLPEKTSSAVAATLDSLERCLGKKTFQQLFGLILTDNGTEFVDTDALERSVFGGKARTKVYYCDPRQSQQKGACEKCHVEIRKLLPKARGISFDELDGHDLAFVMSQINSQPRTSLAGLSSLAMLKAAQPQAADALMAALGFEKLDYSELNLTLGGLNKERKIRGLDPLI